jgi:lipopolysaccharide transport system permease protein
VWCYRELLPVPNKRDIQIVYKQAVTRMRSGDVPYPLFSFVVVLPWTYFAEAVRRSCTGMVTDAELIRKFILSAASHTSCGRYFSTPRFRAGFYILPGPMVCYGIVPAEFETLSLSFVAVAALLLSSLLFLKHMERTFAV